MKGHAQSCWTLWDPVDCSPQGSSVHGILQARILKSVAMPISRGIFPTQGWNPGSPALQAHTLPAEPPGKPRYIFFWCSVSKLCLTLCDPTDFSMLGLPVPHHLPEFAQVHVHWISDVYMHWSIEKKLKNPDDYCLSPRSRKGILFLLICTPDFLQCTYTSLVIFLFYFLN